MNNRGRTIDWDVPGGLGVVYIAFWAVVRHLRIGAGTELYFESGISIHGTVHVQGKMGYQYSMDLYGKFLFENGISRPAGNASFANHAFGTLYCMTKSSGTICGPISKEVSGTNKLLITGSLTVEGDVTLSHMVVARGMYSHLSVDGTLTALSIAATNSRRSTEHIVVDCTEFNVPPTNSTLSVAVRTEELGPKVNHGSLKFTNIAFKKVAIITEPITEEFVWI
jgi:hypothetical protein